MWNVLGREDLSWEGKWLLNRILQSFQGCNRNTWEWDIHQELSGMLILAELSAGGPNTHLFGLVQYVSYCLPAQRLKLWWFKPGRACLNRRDQVSGVLVWGNRWEQEYQLAACWIFRFLVGDVLVSERVIWQWFGSDCDQPNCEGAWEKAKRFDLGRKRKKTGLCDWRGFWEHILAHGRGR